MNEEKFELFDYQKTGVAWLSARRVALLADRQRLGKTVQAIRAADEISAKKILVICPGVVKSNWLRQFGRWSKTRPRQQITVSTYHSLHHILSNPDNVFDLVICDESHYLKSVDTKRTSQVFGKSGVCRRTKYLWCLTGTPTPNHAGELWTMLFTFGATKMNYEQFIKKFCITKHNGFGLQIIGTKTDSATLDEFQTLVKPYVLRRTEDDVSIELPEMFFTTLMIEPSTKYRIPLALDQQFWRYDTPERMPDLEAIVAEESGIIDAFLKVNDVNTMSSEFIEFLKVNAKSLSTVRKYTGLQKLYPVIEFLNEKFEAKAFEKIVLFSHHQCVIRGLQMGLKRFNPMTVYGGSDPKQVEKNLKKFQDPKSRTRVFIGHIASAGLGIDLSVANHIFMVEQSWTPSDNAQAVMRCSGPNQKKPVFVVNFCLNNSIDETVQEILRRKTREQSLLWKEQIKGP